MTAYPAVQIESYGDGYAPVTSWVGEVEGTF